MSEEYKCDFKLCRLLTELISYDEGMDEVLGFFGKNFVLLLNIEVAIWVEVAKGSKDRMRKNA